ncbi:MAG: GNAT family N-acetyltransferase [Candidatus Neomarinimicrobiota bacterium]
MIELFFKKDDWLSEALNKNVFILFNFLDVNENSLLIAFNELCDQYSLEDLFIFVKVKTDFIRQINKIEDLGFKLIDTNILFKRNTDINYKKNLKNNIQIKFAEDSHKSRIGKIAFNNFKFSRFHLDPYIKKYQADNLKKNWVENFFLGKRGDYMVIALSNDRPIAFLQLIKKEKILIIDLIAVSSNYRGGNIGSSMINFACKNIECEKIIVGTQITNLPSIKLYQNLGFKPFSSDYVFHYHNV